MKRFIALALTVALSGCSTISTETDYNTEVDFSRYQSWDWVKASKPNSDKAELPTNQSLHHSGLMDQRIRAAVATQLSQRGLQQQQNADLLVNYFTTVESKVNIDTFYNDFGYHPYRWGRSNIHTSLHSETRVREYKEGTLVVDLIDASSKQLVWRGTGTDTIKKGLSPEKRTAKINETVTAILEQYPRPDSQD